MSLKYNVQSKLVIKWIIDSVQDWGLLPLLHAPATPVWEHPFQAESEFIVATNIAGTAQGVCAQNIGSRLDRRSSDYLGESRPMYQRHHGRRRRCCVL